MPRLADLLEYIAQDGNEHLWVLLDIKMDNNSDDVMRLIAETIKATAPSPKRPWNDRIALGVWSASFLPFCKKYLPDFAVSYISISTVGASKFFVVPNVSFNILHMALLGPLGSSFITSAQESDRPVYAWTVNDEKKMQWGISKGLDGIVTDDPKKFLEVRKRWEVDGPKEVRFTLGEWIKILQMQMLIFVFGFYVRWKLGMNAPIAKEFVVKPNRKAQ
jgi:glycerophosphoryl diester phosphodiesterase